MKNILVFFGGTTVEHDISCITGVMTLNAIDKIVFNAIPIYVDRKGEWYTGDDLFEIENYKDLNYKNLKRVLIKNGENKLYILKGKRLKQSYPIYSAINCLHGERGEDGSLFGLLSLSNIPLASPSLIPSGIAMDKDITKKVLKGIGIKMVKGETLTSESQIESIKHRLSYPVIVKPCSLGSSIGIECARNSEEFVVKTKSAFRYDTKVLVEKKLANIKEINCACYRDERGRIIVSECERPVYKNAFLSFSDKYENGEREFPANIPISVSLNIKNITEKIYSELNFSGIIRIDFFVKNEEVFVNEINSVPGSLAYYLFTKTLTEFSSILTALIYSSVKEFSAKSTLKREIKTSILNVSGAKGTKTVE